MQKEKKQEEKEKVEKAEWVWIKDAPRYLKENYNITLSEGLLRQWRFNRQYPIFAKVGGKIFVDIRKMFQIFEESRED